MYGPFGQQAIQDIIDSADQYKIDGAIYWAFMGCRHTCATIKIVKEALNENGIPMLTLDCDIVDPTVNSEEEIRDKITQFLEMLEDNKSMNTLGIDIGSLTIKAVVLGDEGILGTVIVPPNDEIEDGARAAIDKALGQANLSSDRMPMIATGIGSKLVPFIPQQKAMTMCLARGIHYMFPSVRMVIDMGAESTTVIKVNERGRLADWVNHDKCASGTGFFLQQMAKLMNISMSEMAQLSLQAHARADITSTCAVFAESEVISHVHRDPPTPKEDIAAGIHFSVVSRVMSLCKRIGIVKDIAVTGGVALNEGLINIMEQELGFDVLKPKAPQIVAALGAAIIAGENVSKGIKS